MIVLKCKMCGGDLQISPNTTICECEYCGSKQTIPNTDDERRLKLYERANKLRYDCEFDKASGVYESIVAEFQSEAEAYWGLVLCKFGIEYVDDPKTGKKIPTCHRSSFDSVFDDDNFERVMENTDSVAMDIYRSEAKQIEELRKGILAVSSKEEPYDIFICYKETDENGDRTVDSVLAQKVFTELESNGYRVFFSRISLEDKLGREYEPYIFSALNSAKVMLAFGTSYKNYNAIWVKNEWGRFLQLMEDDSSKVLIPCFKEIDAYDMPKEFSVLQAQDMGKVGAIQDLLRGIDKIFGRDRQKVNVSTASTTAVLKGESNSAKKRADLYLEDGEWEKAFQYYEQALDAVPDDAEIHLGKFLANCYCPNLEAFLSRQINKLDSITPKKNQACEPNNELVNKVAKENVVPGYLSQAEIKDQFSYVLTYDSYLEGLEKEKEIYEDKDWKKAERFATGELLNGIHTVKKQHLEEIDKRLSQEKENDVNHIEKISKDYAKFLEEKEKEIIDLRFKAEAKREGDYNALCERVKYCNTETDYLNLIKAIESFGEYKDSKGLVSICNNCIKEIKKREQEEREARKNAIIKRVKMTSIIVASAVIIMALAFGGYKLYEKKILIPKQQYNDALSLMENEEYEDAIKAFETLGDYKDAKNKIVECNAILESIKDAEEQRLEQERIEAEEIEAAAKQLELEENYSLALSSIDDSDYDSAISLLSEIDDEDYKNEIVDCMVDKLVEEFEDASDVVKMHNACMTIYDNYANDDQKEKLVQANDVKCIEKGLYNVSTDTDYMGMIIDSEKYHEDIDKVKAVLAFYTEIKIITDAYANWEEEYYDAGIDASLKYDADTHCYKIDYEKRVVENSEAVLVESYKGYYVIDCTNDSMLLGTENDIATLQLNKYGTITSLVTPVEMEAYTVFEEY